MNTKKVEVASPQNSEIDEIESIDAPEDEKLKIENSKLEELYIGAPKSPPKKPKKPKKSRKKRDEIPSEIGKKHSIFKKCFILYFIYFI